MSGSYRTCCVPKCGNKSSDTTILHFFPNPSKDIHRFLTWRNAVGESLSSLSYEYVYNNRKICSDHFDDKYKTWKGRLSNIALPTLLVPEGKLHVFPNPNKFPEQYKAWVQVVRG